VPVEVGRREKDAEHDERYRTRRKHGQDMPAVARSAAGRLVECPCTHLAEHDA
jgi:hypothetical protein